VRNAIKKTSRDIESPRALPHSIEAEQAVLGSILLDAGVVEKALESLSPDGSDFYEPLHKSLFRLMVVIHSKGTPVDLITLLDAVEEDREARTFLENIGGLSYVASIVEGTPTAANAVYYVNIVKDRAIKRYLIGVASELVAAAYDSDDIETLIEGVQRNLSKTSISTLKPYVLAGALVKEVYEDLEELSKSDTGMAGIPTGFKGLDGYTGGLQDTDLIVIAGRPSMGKTALSVQMATYMALKESRKVGIFSIEVGRKHLMKNIFACQARIETSKFRSAAFNEKDWDKLTSAAGDIAGANIFVDELSRSSEAITRQARKMRAENGLDIIFIDHLQQMNENKRFERRDLEIGQITANLKDIAKELEIPVVLISQLNRGVVGRDVKIPNMGDLSGSGSIEQDADVIIFIHRDEYYTGEQSERPGVADIIIAKQRNGRVGSLELEWSAPYVRFDNSLNYQ